MLIPRAATIRSFFRATRSTTSRARSLRQTFRRGYATETHEVPTYGGDALWATGAILVTIPPCWYLLSNRANHHHHHDEPHDLHEDEDTENDSDNDPEQDAETLDKAAVDNETEQNEPTENEEQSVESSSDEDSRDCSDVKSKDIESESDCHCSSRDKEQDHLSTLDTKESTQACNNNVETKNDESTESTKLQSSSDQE